MRTISNKKDIPIRTLPKEYGNGIAVSKVSAASFLADDETMHAHRHDYHFFVLQEKGITHTEIDFEQYIISTPTILYQSPNQVHRALKVENIEMYILIISNENIHPDYLKLLQNIAPLKPLSIRHKELTIVRQAFRLCTNLYERKSDKLYLSSLQDSCNALAGLIISLYLRQVRPSESLSRFERITNEFFRLLERDFLTEKRPSYYAEALHISVSYLNECVKDVTGQSVSHHIQQRVILEAKRLLYHSDKAVKEIAAILGYDDYPYFSRLFTKTTGMTAVTFRNKNRE
ncbi:AraC family transcriptional regulator [Sphingobacterium chuzhouense]|uniref:Helix-turn-helix domain-containing protein n=1 Tax=Sphingobacterium chuzhouense TaxID=1742264 RepID=A0ABR7XTQ5_9SPHI|nr:helix-turn-helix domain-containing protein [Sphingobacterium chuzhouense]MBD1422547.1 helix-turn-helix domain-containing protein [Sphingobacterium chuzhouense]